MDQAFLRGLVKQTGSKNYWLTGYVILRVLGSIYAIAFLVAINQVLPLIGFKHQLSPARRKYPQVAAD